MLSFASSSQKSLHRNGQRVQLELGETPTDKSRKKVVRQRLYNKRLFHNAPDQEGTTAQFRTTDDFTLFKEDPSGYATEFCCALRDDQRERDDRWKSACQPGSCD